MDESGARTPAGLSTNAGRVMPPTTHRAPLAARLPMDTVVHGRYRVTGVLGVGGMSVVYRALDLHFKSVERVCAIKEMFYPGSNEEDRSRRLQGFEREAGLLAVLSHPAIPKIYDYFADGGRAYLVQEFVPGRNLEVLSQEKGAGYSEQEVRAWGMQVCDVLMYLHGQQPHPIIFRDLKPSNIMLGEHGTLMVIDFGIARAFQRTQRGTMIGTEGYAPPEQYRGIADPRVDVYALGATLHHLATGDDPRYQAPFTFEQRRPRLLNPTLSERFEQVILKAVAYAADDRFPSALEFKLALRATARETKVPASPNLVVRAQGIATAPIPPLPVLVSSPAEPAATAVSSPDANPLAVDRLLWSAATGDEVRGGGTVAGPLLLIGSYDANLYAIARDTGAVRWRFATGRGICAAPATYEEFAIVASEDGAIYGSALLDGRPAWRFRTSMPVRSSPRVYDGAVYVGSDDGYCYKLAAPNGELLWRARTYGPIRSSAAVTTTVAVIGSNDGFLYGLDVASGRQLWRFATAKPIVATPAIAEQIVVCASLDGSIYGLGLALGDERWRCDTGGPVVASPAIGEDTVYIGSSTGKLYAIDLLTGAVRWTADCGGRISSSAALSAARVYVGGLDGTVYSVDRASGRVAWSFALGRPLPASPTLAPDGEALYIGCTDGKVYALATHEAGKSSGA